ncbi:hypothetical protein [Hymenobacter norwichensis]|uniref:hypothetical protein n=1 Tax=Hymenobacter norwichensis TaxID=223903 RepID=UPI0003B558E2|nr:hypothetical protein [Hymenobacter norwichensis]
MLDFFFIRDEQPSDHALTQAEYAGGLRVDEFEQAKNAQIIEPYLDFYEDFRWSSVQVEQKLTLLQKAKIEETTVLLWILRRAMKLDCGVIAFCD